MYNSTMGDTDQEALNEPENKQKRKRHVWRCVAVGVSAALLAVGIVFNPFGSSTKNDVCADSTPSESLTEPVTEPVDIPEVNTLESTEDETEAPEESYEWVYDDTLTAEENIFVYLTEYLGYSDAAACGIIANIAYETGWKFDPTLGSSRCYGLIQWLGNRLTKLKSWCAENGKDYTTIQGQLDFMDWELKNDDPYGTYKCLMTCENDADGAYEAGWYFCYWYERPNNKKAAAKWRGGEAEKYFKSLVIGDE